MKVTGTKPSSNDTKPATQGIYCNVDSLFVKKIIPPIDELKIHSCMGKTHPLPDSVIANPKYKIAYWYFKNVPGKYYAEDNKGINTKNTRKIDEVLAKYSQNVADNMQTGGACYTGVKYALWDAGVINDYIDMPKGSAYQAKEYFDNNADKFEKVNVTKDKLKDLPAGHIIVYASEGLDGHIAITNGNGQEMSDCTDNMKWLDKYKDGTFSVYKLTDNWQYDEKTKKLRFKK